MTDHSFLVNIAYTPHHMQEKGSFQKKIKTKAETEIFLQQLHQKTA